MDWWKIRRRHPYRFRINLQAEPTAGDRLIVEALSDVKRQNKGGRSARTPQAILLVDEELSPDTANSLATTLPTLSAYIGGRWSNAVGFSVFSYLIYKEAEALEFGRELLLPREPSTRARRESEEPLLRVESILEFMEGHLDVVRKGPPGLAGRQLENTDFLYLPPRTKKPLPQAITWRDRSRNPTIPNSQSGGGGPSAVGALDRETRHGDEILGRETSLTPREDGGDASKGTRVLIARHPKDAEGNEWTIRIGPNEYRLKNLMGARHLFFLAHEEGTSFTAVKLVQEVEPERLKDPTYPDVLRDLHDNLNEMALTDPVVRQASGCPINDYKQILIDLASEREEALQNGDERGASDLRFQIELIQDQALDAHSERNRITSSRDYQREVRRIAQAITDAVSNMKKKYENSDELMSVVDTLKSSIKREKGSFTSRFPKDQSFSIQIEGPFGQSLS